MCGAEINDVDYFAAIRRKYCPKCAKAAKRMQNAEWAREFRRKRREENALTRELCKNYETELTILRRKVQQQKDIIRALEEETT